MSTATMQPDYTSILTDNDSPHLVYDRQAREIRDPSGKVVARDVDERWGPALATGPYALGVIQKECEGVDQKRANHLRCAALVVEHTWADRNEEGLADRWLAELPQRACTKPS